MDLTLIEKFKGPKPMIPADWIWGVSKFLEDDKGGWYVEGYCSTYDLDLVGDLIEPVAAKEAAKQLVGITLLYNHDPDRPVGTCVAADVDDKGIWVKCLISKTEPNTWTKITEGVLNKFSVRLLEHDRKRELRDGRYINRIKKLRIVEMSLTSLPANPAALAGMAYVGKSSITEVDEMDEKIAPAGIVALKSAVDQLIEDFKSGALADIVDEEIKQDYGYGYGKACPFVKTDQCPVTQKNEPNPAKQKEIATACPNSKIYACPYLAQDQQQPEGPAAIVTQSKEVKKMALEPKKDESKGDWMSRCMADTEMTAGYGVEGERTKKCELIFAEWEKKYPPVPIKSVEERLGQVEEALVAISKLGETVKAMSMAVQKTTDEFGKAVENLKGLEAKVTELTKTVETAKADTAEKIKTLETTSALRKGLEEPDPDKLADPKIKSVNSKWKGVFPV